MRGARAVASRSQRLWRGPRFGGALAVLLLILVAGCGGADDDPAPAESPGGAPAEEDVIATVEGVEGGEVTGADLERAVLAAAADQGRPAPVADTPEFDLLAGGALDQLVLARWITAEAASQGGEVPEADAVLLAERMSENGIEELEVTWGERTECDPGYVSRLCGDGGEEPPPDIPPASG